jgi:hypothetical protein
MPEQQDSCMPEHWVWKVWRTWRSLGRAMATMEMERMVGMMNFILIGDGGGEVVEIERVVEVVD